VNAPKNFKPITTETPIKRSSDQAIKRSSDQAIKRSSDQAIKRSSDPLREKCDRSRTRLASRDELEDKKKTRTEARVLN